MLDLDNETSPMTLALLTLLHRFGLVALFSVIGLESMGLPVPGETALLAMTAYAAHVHAWSPTVIFGVAAVAAVVGDNAGYALGRWGGWLLVRRYGRFVRLDESRLKVARYVFARHGGSVVLGGRFVALLRMTSAFLAGVNHMPWRRFLVFNAVGGVAWAAVWTAVGYTLGGRIDLAGGWLHWGLLAVLLAGALTTIAVIRRRWASLVSAAEAAYPDPL